MLIGAESRSGSSFAVEGKLQVTVLPLIGFSGPARQVGRHLGRNWWRFEDLPQLCKTLAF